MEFLSMGTTLSPQRWPSADPVAVLTAFQDLPEGFRPRARRSGQRAGRIIASASMVFSLYWMP
eukprot:7117276-Pyramimonas_sp.AAC.1